MKRWMTLLPMALASILVFPPPLRSQTGNGNPVRVALIKMPYVGERNVPDVSRGPEYLEQGGIQKLLEDQGVQTKHVLTLALTPDEEKAYGSWNHLALARPALPTRHIVEMCVRDTDPLEQELLDRSEIQQLTLEDVRTRSANLHREMKRLSEATDVIYIHVDMDALDPREVPGHPLTVPGGPTSAELAAALTEMFKYEKTAAFGVASTPFDERDKAGVSRQAAYNLILGAVKGVQQRNRQ